MLQFKIQGRGGQGVLKAAEILAEAFFREGKYIQAYATYGGARRGTPVSSFVRVDDKPIRLRCDIENPDVIVCFDPSLLTDTLLKGAAEGTSVLINSANSPAHYAALGNFKVVTVDAIAIAYANELGRIVNTILVGAFAGLLKSPGSDILVRVIREKSPAMVEQNVKAFLAGFRSVTGGMN
ncbi:MAG: 2-oxoacid:acceptor oxidoreductase family protein [Bacillota bacterium]